LYNSGFLPTRGFLITVSRLLFFLLGCAFLVACHNSGPDSAPPGTDYEGPFRPVENLRFLYDKSYVNEHGKRVSEHEIFDQVFALIGQSTRFILLDMFLFNDFKGKQAEIPRPLSEELTQALLQQKSAFPHCEIILITDPINTVYGAKLSPHFERLQSAGITVVMTDLQKLPDSNTLYSPLWRAFFASNKRVPEFFVANPFDQGKVPLASMLSLINFKANHRKVVIGANDQTISAIVSSANPHDGSGAHENLALRFSGRAVLDLLDTERSVLRFSGSEDVKIQPENYPTAKTGDLAIRVITERAIKKAALSAINASAAGDAIDMAMFYLSERTIIHALVSAQARGVAIRMLLDPNKDAFGRKKNGIPNRQVAHELVEQGVSARWCLTQGEQCHSKLLMVRYNDGSSRIILGSANFTRRNIDGFNLETDVEIRGESDHAAIIGLVSYFENRWSSREEQQTSLPYSAFSDSSRFKYWQYRLMEASGLSTF
jgi:hypothetical protein